MDTKPLRQAHEQLLKLAAEGGFGPPPDGEWDAARLLAHVGLTDATIAAVALGVIAGQRPTYDNRYGLEEWNLARVVSAADGMDGLLDFVRQQGDLLCAVGDALEVAHQAVLINVLIVSNGELVVDQPWTLGALVEGVGSMHIPPHIEQLRRLRP